MVKLPMVKYPYGISSTGFIVIIGWKAREGEREMKRGCDWKAVIELGKLNDARRQYEEAANEEVKQLADTAFADCYDRLVSCGVPIYFDHQAKLWLLYSSPVQHVLLLERRYRKSK
jgi:hypothetical protein